MKVRASFEEAYLNAKSLKKGTLYTYSTRKS